MSELKLFGYSSDEEKFDDRYLKPSKRKGKKKVANDKSITSIPGVCFYCNVELNKRIKTKDHVYPKSRGGRFTVPCCRYCNTEKRDMTIYQYLNFLIADFKKVPAMVTTVKIKNIIKYIKERQARK